MRLLTLGFALSALALAACSSSSSSDGGNNPFGGENPSGEKVNCDSVISQEKVDAFNSASPVANVAGLRGQGTSYCTETQTINGQATQREVHGFAAVTVVPSVTLLPTTSLSDDSVLIHAKVATISKADLDEVKKAFGAVDLEQMSPIGISNFNWESVTLADLPETSASLTKLTDAVTGKQVDALQIWMPSYLSAQYRSAIAGYAAGSAQVQFETVTAVNEASIGSFGPGQAVQLSKFKRVSGVTFLSDRWVRIERLGQGNWRELPYVWMSKYSMWSKRLSLKPAQAQQAFAGPYALANSQWNPRRETFGVSRSNLLSSLRFLREIDPSGANQVQFHALDVLNEFLSGDSDVLYEELVDITEVSRLTPDQERILVNTARKIKSANGWARDAWTNARTIARMTNYEEAKMSTVAALAAWLKNTGGRWDLDVAVTSVTTYGFTEDRLPLLDSTYKYFYKQFSSSESLERAMNLVVKSRATPDRVALHKDAYTWFYKQLSSSEAMKRADLYVIDKGMDRAQFTTLQGTFDWLYKSLSSSESLKRAEEYVFTNGLTPDGLQQLVKVYDFLYKQLSSSESLNRTELYVITKKLSRVQTDTLEAAYVWLYKYLSANESLKSAEKYVLELSVTPEKFQALVKKFDEYYRTLSTSESLKRAEKDVLGI